jgi:hypothetical protein
MPEIREPAVVRAMREYRDGMALREAEQMGLMARRWVEVEDNLAGQIEGLAFEIDLMAREGKVITPNQIMRMERFKRLMAQAQAETGRYAEWAAGVIQREQESMGRLAIDQAAEAIRQSFGNGIGTQFDKLPVDAINGMMGMTGEGSPLRDLLRMRMVDDAAALGRLTESLLRGVALGWNPRKTAEAMKNDLAGGLQKALVIARTEQMRVYREAARLTYLKSGVVTGQRRLTGHGRRTCAACLADEGTVYGLDMPLPDHPQGRCVGVPVVIGGAKSDWLNGEDWLRTQDEGMQRDILGPGRFELWKDGKLAVHTHDPVWGAGVRMATMGELGYSVSDVRGFLKGAVNKIKSIILSGKQVAQNSVEETLKKFEEGIVKQPYESAMALDSSGNVILKKDGTSGNVFFTDPECVLMKDGILTHNHPSYGGSFSEDDIHFSMGHDLEAIRAVGDEYLHIMTRTSGMWDENYWNSQAVQDAIYKANSEAIKIYKPQKDNNLIDQRTFEQERTHYIWDKLSKDLGWNYERRLR